MIAPDKCVFIRLSASLLSNLLYLTSGTRAYSSVGMSMSAKEFSSLEAQTISERKHTHMNGSQISMNQAYPIYQKFKAHMSQCVCVRDHECAHVYVCVSMCLRSCVFAFVCVHIPKLEINCQRSPCLEPQAWAPRCPACLLWTLCPWRLGGCSQSADAWLAAWKPRGELLSSCVVGDTTALMLEFKNREWAGNKGITKLLLDWVMSHRLMSFEVVMLHTSKRGPFLYFSNRCTGCLSATTFRLFLSFYSFKRKNYHKESFVRKTETSN